ncbi:MAG: PIN domain-containing protein [Propionibacteriaceae bacterium]|nr:PIN domain-containing protein [Propionibacteriaceae bacterium]
MAETYVADANVLYSRVLRDYLLYAMRAKLIVVVWSRSILDEVTEHLIQNRLGFTQESADRLVSAMNDTYPYSQRDAQLADFQAISGLELPDEDDRHVIATAIGAPARFICTHDVRHFPPGVMDRFGLAVVTPDDVLCPLIWDHEELMLWVHRMSVGSLPGATDETTMAALRNAGAQRTASLIAELLH